MAEKLKAKADKVKTVTRKKKAAATETADTKSAVSAVKPKEPVVKKRSTTAARAAKKVSSAAPAIHTRPAAASAIPAKPAPVEAPSKPVIPSKGDAPRMAPHAKPAPLKEVKHAAAVSAPVKPEPAAPAAAAPVHASADSGVAAVSDVREEKAPVALEFATPITLKDLAIKLGVKPNELILNLMGKKILVTINQGLGEDLVKNILTGYGFEYRKPQKIEQQVAAEHKEMEEKQDVKHLVLRSPVVTFMGHVDHGKTSLLDYIRKTHVADKEKGGITQHIGAYEVRVKNGSVTFLDTPGHAAFTAMRARGANITDIVVLVIAADDGIMPQTKEALDHARAAGVTIVVAVNKCDLPAANVEKVKTQLTQIGLMPEDWGGKTITIPVSAKTGEGVDHLLEMLLLEAELLELKANPHLRARGIVIEGKLSSGQGAVATILVKNGTLRVGDMIVCGRYYGRIKAMMDHTGHRIEEAPPSKPVSVLGLSGVPMSGVEFFAVKDEKKARTLAMLKQDEARHAKLKVSKRVTLEDFYTQMKEGGVKQLTIIIKGDVQGSIEALKKSLTDLNARDVSIDIIHVDVGNINESDIMLAVVSNAVVIGFNVKMDEGAEALAAKENVEVKIYGIIYEAIQDVMAAMEGLLEPVERETLIGRAVVKQAFGVSKVGTIAGCTVVKGKMTRHGIAKLVRSKEVVYTGKISSLKRFKDDAREVNEGFECGIGLERHNDIKAGDMIELYQIEKVARRLEARRQM